MADRGTSRYSLLKFVPDRLRFEPINVGIVVEGAGRVVTRMAGSVDPRVRFADPYADLESLRGFLETFDARSLKPATDQPLLEWLHEVEIPNIYVTSPLPIDQSAAVELVADRLFSRLVERNFARPPMSPSAPSHTAARRALLAAFRAEGVLGSKVTSGVKIRGASGVDWTVDFRFATNTLNLVQAATTGLRDNVHGKEHAFEAFASLIDTRQPGTSGILASDASSEENDVTSQIDKMATAHGIRFVGGRRAFMRLAREVRTEALAVNEPRDMALFPAP